MIAVRPLHFKINKITFDIREGREISKQVLSLLKVDECKKNGVIVDTLDDYKKIISANKSKEKAAIKKGEDQRKKIIDARNGKPENKKSEKVKK